MIRNNIKYTNIYVIEFSEEEKNEWVKKKFEKLMPPNFPNVKKNINAQIQEAQ